MQKLIFALVVVVLLILGVAALVMVGDLKPAAGSEKLSLGIASAVLAQVSGSHAGMVGASETNSALAVYVDVSSSMAGYALSDLKANNTTFLKVIELLSRRAPGKLYSLSTALGAGKAQAFDWFRDKSHYTGGLDMAKTIDQFAADPGQIHAFVTDSQPWDAGDKPAYEKVAGAINGFLGTGGRCVMVLYRSQYRGIYSSPLLVSNPTQQPTYVCPDRPFALWLFAPKGCALSQVLTELGQATDLKIEEKVQFGEPDLNISLAGRAVAEKATPGKPGPEIGRISAMPTGHEVGRIKEYSRLQLKSKAIDTQGYVPLQFDITGMNGEAPEKIMARLNRGLSVRLDSWEVPVNFKPAPAPGLNADPDKAEAGKKAAKAADPKNKLTHLWQKELESTLTLVTNAPSTNSAGLVLPGGVAARLVVPAPRPTDAGKHFAWVLTLRPKDPKAQSVLEPGKYSTPDDRDSTACNKILKLDEMLQIVSGETVRWGSVLFLTDYPK